MLPRQLIDSFLEQSVLAVAGVSRNPKSFSRQLFKALRQDGRRLLPVNPLMDRLEDLPCFPSLEALPEPAGGVPILTPPDQLAGMVRSAHQCGIGRLWVQPGACSPEALADGRARGLEIIDGLCLFMFLEPAAFPHRLHRGLLKLAGRFPR